MLACSNPSRRGEKEKEAHADSGTEVSSHACGGERKRTLILALQQSPGVGREKSECRPMTAPK